MDNWKNSCRACLIKADSFSHFIGEQITPKQYFYCTSIQIKHKDGLPKAICDNCFKLINQFIEFKTKCIQSENTLVTLLGDSLVKPEPHLELEYEIKNIKEDLEVVWERNNENNDCTTDIRTDMNTEIYDTKKEEKKEILNYSDDNNFTDEQIDFLDTIENNLEPTRVSLVKNNIPLKKGRRKEFKCENCNKIFSSINWLKRHMLVHEKPGPIECKDCNKTYASTMGLHCHIKSCHTHYSFKDVTCQICSKVCKNPFTLRAHQKTHELRRERVCDECGKVFKSDVTFKNHLETHIKNRERNFPCQHCGKKYISKKTCAKHISRRHTDKQFICNYCDYVFTDKANLIRHIMIHEGRHPKYKCDICSRSFKSQASVLVHKRMHTGEKPYSCSHCRKSFSDRAWLVEHERNHTGEKPFQCLVCTLRFSRRGSMRRHLKVHNMWEGCKRKNRGGVVKSHIKETVK